MTRSKTAASPPPESGSPRESAPQPESGSPSESGLPELGDYPSRVLDVAESIPPGRVMSYGDVAEYLGEGGPRQVGRVMSLWGGGVPWWRVVHSDGSFLSGHEREAVRHYRAEGTPLRFDADGRPAKLNMRLARWSGLAPDGTEHRITSA